jgi:hypothetical protein
MNQSQSQFEHDGERLAQFLRGAWRAEPPPLSQNEAQARAVVPLALKGGCAGLAYWRLRKFPAFTALAQELLRAAYVENGIRAASSVYQLQGLADALRDAGIEPLLFKGWAIARHYPELALRPMGDVDLFVAPAQLERARGIVAQKQTDAFRVDLHTEPEDALHATRVTGRTLDDLYARSERVTLGSTHVRVLSPEDHLHLLSMHFLRHGGWRPLWLCDIAVALETRARDFDWARALGEGKTADWVTCVLGAAHQLLDARIEDTPCVERAQQLPRWFVATILAEWSDPDPACHYPPDPIRRVWKQPRKLTRALRARWFNPIEASVMLNAPFDETPRVWYQARYWLKQFADFVTRPR